MREIKAMLLQQVESHLLKVSLLGISNRIMKKGLDARIVACVHDSISVEAAAKEGSEVRRIMEKVMTKTLRLSVPLVVDIED